MTLPTIGQIAEFVYTVILGPAPLRAATNWTIKRLLPETCSEGTAVVFLNPDDPVVSGALALGVYERAEIAFFRRHLRPGQRVLDIGANVGLFTALASNLVGPDGRVDAFEPDPDSFRFLEKTARANPAAQIELHPLGLADAAGTTRLHMSLNNRGDNRLYAHKFSSASVVVNLSSVDEFWQGGKIPRPDFIKMDVQGYEGHVLAGMRQLLGDGDPLTLLFEFWPEGLRQAGSDSRQVIRKLQDGKFTLSELAPDGSIQPLSNVDALLQRLSGRKYTNLVATR